MRRGVRILLVVVGVLAGGAALAWRYQSEIIGAGARWYLARIAAQERASGSIARRRDAVTRLHRVLLLEPPADALVPELYDVMTLLADDVATGEMSVSWAAYVYTGYVRDMIRDRPNGQPPRTVEQMEAHLASVREFYAIRKRPDVPGVRVRDFTGGGPDEYTLEEIEQAAREGRELPLR